MKWTKNPGPPYETKDLLGYAARDPKLGKAFFPTSPGEPVLDVRWHGLSDYAEICAVPEPDPLEVELELPSGWVELDRCSPRRNSPAGKVTMQRATVTKLTSFRLPLAEITYFAPTRAECVEAINRAVEALEEKP